MNNSNKTVGKGLEETFLQRNTDRHKHMKRFSVSLIIRKIQIKVTVSYHFTSTRMTIIKRQKITSVDKNVEKLETTLLVGKMLNYYGEQFGGSLKAKYRITI